MNDTSSRPIEILRAGWGTWLMLWPRGILTDLPHVRTDDKSVVVTRILGARHLTQATLSGIRPSPEVLAMGVWVDAIHALTALGLAATDRSRARAGLIDAAMAGAWTALGYRDLGRATAVPGDWGRLRDRLARNVLAKVPGGAVLLRRARGAGRH